MSATNCSTESLIPLWVTVSFSAGSALSLIGTAIYSMTILINDPSMKWKQLNCFSKLKLWLKDIIGRKSVYLALVAHLADTSTDYATIVEFYTIGIHTDPKTDCNGLNVLYLFGLSICCIIAYRVISSITVYRITSSVKRFIMQFLDLELFNVLYLSHFMRLKTKSSPQRLIASMEAVFEAAPQTLIQFLYIFTMQNALTSNIVFYSAILSLFNLTTTIIGEDKIFLNIRWGSAQSKFENDRFGESPPRIRFVLLYIFRIFDIPSKILLFVFVWYLINGYVLTIVIGIDFLAGLCCFVVTKSSDALLSVVALPFSFGTSEHDRLNLYSNTEGPCLMKHTYVKLLYINWFYSLLLIVIINSIILININISNTNESAFMVALLLFSVIASLVKFVVLFVFVIFFDGKNYLTTVKDKKNIDRMLDAGYYSDILELTFYKDPDTLSDKNMKKLYGVARHYPLLSIAVKAQNIRIIDLILNKRGFDDYDLMGDEWDETKAYNTALMSAVFDGNEDIMKLLMKHPSITIEYVTKWKGICSRPVLQTIVSHEQYNSLLEPFLEAFTSRFLDQEEEVNHALKLQLLYHEQHEKFCPKPMLVYCAEKCCLEPFKTLCAFYPDPYKKEALHQVLAVKGEAGHLEEQFHGIMGDFINEQMEQCNEELKNRTNTL